MKKPKKPKPKAKQRQAVSPAPSPLRAHGHAANPGFRYASARSRTVAARRTVTARLSALADWGSAATERGRAAAQGLAHKVTAFDARPHIARVRAQARSLTLPYSQDERETLALVFLPVLLVATAIVTHQSVRTLAAYVTSIGVPDHEVVSLQPIAGGRFLPVPQHPVPAREVEPRATVSSIWPAPDAVPSGAFEPDVIVTRQPALEAARQVSAPFRETTQVPPDRELAHVGTESPLPSAAGEIEVAHLAPAPGVIGPAAGPATLLATFEADENGRPVYAGICRIGEAAPAQASPASFTPIPADGEAFGRRLAAAAQTQVGRFVVYDDAYRSIRYPMGDVNSFFGVCTDVVVRAYRDLGIDLQTRVQEARAGRGDRNIDHRRTEVLRRFFAARGESLPVTAFAENYRPGDIVTYYRPQNQRSRSHIAIVSNVVAPSGRPMIIHNRGWGPQLEDALFVDEVTGHYRYSGQARPRDEAAKRRPPAPRTTVLPASYAPVADGDRLRAE